MWKGRDKVNVRQNRRRRQFPSCYNWAPSPSAQLVACSGSDTSSDDADRAVMESPASEFRFSDSNHCSDMLSELNEMRKSGSICDVTLNCGGVRFPAHRVVLSALSSYFKAMFLGSLAESKQNLVTINGMEPESLALLLEFAYTAKVTITRNNVQSLLAASNLLEVTAVKNATCHYLASHIDASNCLGIFCFAELHFCTLLEEKAKSYALDNFTDVLEQEEFLNLPLSKLIELTSSDYLIVKKEETVFEAIFRWYMHKPEERASCFPELLGTIRLALVSPYYLVDCIESAPIVSGNPDCLNLTEEAKLYHLLPDRRHELPASRSKPRLNSDTIEVIVAVGGEDEKVVLRAVECFSPRTGEWYSLASLPCAISKHGLVCSSRNTLYLAGGEFPDGSPSQCVWRYDPVLDYWQELENMHEARSELALATLDGFLYAVGGWNGSLCLNTVERYDPDTNSWSDVSPMKYAVNTVTIVAHDRHLYVTGTTFKDDGQEMTLPLQKYNPRTNSWCEMSRMTLLRSGAAMATLGSYIYVVGGWYADKSMDQVEAFNCVTGFWETRASMCEKRYRPGIAVLEGKLYVFGGEYGPLDKYHDSVECYDPANDAWNICGKMITARSWLGCVPLQVKKSSCRHNEN